MLFLLLCFLGRVIPGSVAVPYHDMMELNHHYSDKGVLIFSQVVFWSDEYYRFESRGFVLDRDFLSEPEKTDCGYLFRYREGGRIMMARSSLFRESWTVIDPERVSSGKQKERDENIR